MIPEAGPKEINIYPLAENAVTVEFGKIITEEVSGKVTAFDTLLKTEPLAGMYQTVPAYATLTVYFDPRTLFQSALPGAGCFEKAANYLSEIYRRTDFNQKTEDARLITIPVYYNGPELEYVANQHQLTTGEVIRLHSGAEYRVYMMGFIPGFAYLGGLNPLLQTPRKPSPVKVSPGSVGIAGNQTGIYPLEIPGGWQIIGHTPIKMFEAGRGEPSLLKSGDRVRFEPIALAEFEKISRA